MSELKDWINVVNAGHCGVVITPMKGGAAMEAYRRMALSEDEYRKIQAFTATPRPRR
ncbi:hypothetical protein [Pseudomonas aeruginosa]|uniref:hypothetical protein n=1 Tax=Pseudomonas aeruginosa TaxID=287 RepID=UPI00157B0CA6|nr:hypothetical protein [Pseudomonas aeruginosa]